MGWNQYPKRKKVGNQIKNWNICLKKMYFSSVVEITVTEDNFRPLNLVKLTWRLHDGRGSNGSSTGQRPGQYYKQGPWQFLKVLCGHAHLSLLPNPVMLGSKGQWRLKGWELMQEQEDKKWKRKGRQMKKKSPSRIFTNNLKSRLSY